MSGYTPLFQSLTTGTLCGKWPDIGLWPIVLSLADKQGIVDVTPDYLARITGLPIDDVTACMARFCEPDPYSRTPTDEGRRLALIDPENRCWGWKVLNHAQYRERARKQQWDNERTASGRDAERKRNERAQKKDKSVESRDIPARPDASRRSPLSDADTDPYSRSAQTRSDDGSGGSGTGKPKTSRGSRLPEDWKPDADFALREISDLDVEREADRFRDYWRAQPGQKGVKVDWRATWCNWVRNARDRGTYARRTNGGSSRAHLPELKL